MWRLFTDLRKAYNSVPSKALWIALRKLGVPDIMHRSFHGIKARICLDNTLLDEVEENNGLRQGRLLHGPCAFQPTLVSIHGGVVGS